MAIGSLRQVITGNFVKALSSQSKAANSNSVAVRANNDAASLDTSLRTGARNISAGLQALNVGITYINVSRNTHQKLLDVVTRIDLLVSKGSKGGIGSQNEGLMQQEFQALSKEFQELIKDAKLQGSDVLDVTTLSEVLIRAGLDPEKSNELGNAFEKISSVTKGESEAGTDQVTSPNALLPLDGFARALRRTAGDFAEVEEGGDPGVDPGTAFRPVRDRLKEIRDKLETNIKALDSAVEVIGKNISLARAAGFAFLNMSEEVKGNEDPETIAARLRDQIRRGAPEALGQADNLNAIMVAGFSLRPDTFKSIKKKAS